MKCVLPWLQVQNFEEKKQPDKKKKLRKTEVKEESMKSILNGREGCENKKLNEKA